RGNRLRKIVSVVVMIAPIPARPPVPVIAHVAPVPIRSPAEACCNQDKKDQEHDAASAHVRRRFTMAARPYILRQFGYAPEDEQQRPIMGKPEAQTLPWYYSSGAQQKNHAQSNQHQRTKDGTRARPVIRRRR